MTDRVNQRITEILGVRQGGRLEAEDIAEITAQLTAMLAASPRVAHAADALAAWNIDTHSGMVIRQPRYEEIVREVLRGVMEYDDAHPATVPATRPEDKHVPCPVEVPQRRFEDVEGSQAGQQVVVNALIMSMTALRYFAADRLGKQFSVGDAKLAENRAAWCKRTLDMLVDWGWLPSDHELSKPYSP